MQTQIFDTAQHCVEHIAEQFRQLSEENRPVHLSLSGGSTPKLLFQTLARAPFNTAIRWENLHFWWGDERMVAPSDPESNFGEVQRLLFDHIILPKANIHRIRGENDPQAELARFTAELDQVPNHTFDWILLGMGNDGHTASLFPHQTHFEDDNLATIAKHPETGQLRISKTAKLIRQAKRVTYLVTGAAKADILREIQQNKAEDLAYPAAKIGAENGITEWYLDNAAAEKLSPFHLDGKHFVALQNSANGEVSSQTQFAYHQQGKMIWAEYGGGEILKGFLIGTQISENQFEFSYQHLNRQYQNRSGRCLTTFEIQGGKLVGNESWQWQDTQEKGLSVIQER